METRYHSKTAAEFVKGGAAIVKQQIPGGAEAHAVTIVRATATSVTVKGTNGKTACFWARTGEMRGYEDSPFTLWRAA